MTGLVIGVILLVGVYMATDRDQWDKPWLMISLVLLFVIAGLGATVLRRSEERLLASAEAGDEANYSSALGTARTWTLCTIALIVLTIYVMSAKPFD